MRGGRDNAEEMVRREWRSASGSTAAMWFTAESASSADAEVLLALVEEARTRRRARREVCGGAEEVGGRSSTEEMLWISLRTELAQGGGTRGATSSAGPGLEKRGTPSWMLYSLGEDGDTE